MRSLSASILPCIFLSGSALLACSPAGGSEEPGSVGGSPVGGPSGATGGSTSGGAGALGETGGATHGSGGAATASGGATNSTGGSSGANGGSGGATTASGGASQGAGGGDPEGSGGASAELASLTIFLAGDSTVSTYADTASPSDQAGWGQMLHELLDEKAKVDNRAIGGRTARRFIDEGALDKIWNDVTSGDSLFVQFGTNDGNKTATYELNGQTIPYYLDPNTDFKTYLMQYVEGARARDVEPVFVTPPPRNSAYCTGGNGTGAHAQAMRDLGEAENVMVLDLNARSVAYLTAICPAPTPEDFFLLRGDGSVDGTHFQENGARKLAGFVANELAMTSLPLAAYVK